MHGALEMETLVPNGSRHVSKIGNTISDALHRNINYVRSRFSTLHA